MEWFVRAVIAGITSFVATNIDDIVILTLFFAQVSDRLRPRHIVAGQYLGFIVLLLAALPGFFGGLLLPQSWIGLLGLLPIAIGVKELLNSDDDEAMVQTIPENEIPRNSKLAHLLHPRTYQVAAVTIANGGDNIGIYIPLFASSTFTDLAVIVSVFLIMVAVWCGIAAYLAQHPAIAPLLNRYAHRIVPFVLIALGIYILIENGSHRLFLPT